MPGPVFSLEELEPERRYQVEPPNEVTPETFYERRWAATLLDQVMNRLQTSMPAKASRAVSAAPALSDWGEEIAVRRVGRAYSG